MEIIYFYGSILGLVAGSFVNAWVYRLDSGESVLFERSHCVNCGKTIRWYDLIPLFSFINLRGKCRDCQKPISIEYPLIEAITAVLYVAIIYLNRFAIGNLSGWASIIYQMLLLVFLETIFIFDLKHLLISFNAVIGATVLTIAFKIASLLLDKGSATALGISLIANTVLATIAVAGFLWLLAFISKEKWMGWGDVQVGLLMGVILGYPNALIALFIAFVVGAIIGLALIIAKGKSPKAMVPFAPFLIVGTVVAFYWGNGISLWYGSIIGL
ncbi:MAG: prepilin peptidase [bacterium]